MGRVYTRTNPRDSLEEERRPVKDYPLFRARFRPDDHWSKSFESQKVGKPTTTKPVYDALNHLRKLSRPRRLTLLDQHRMVRNQAKWDASTVTKGMVPDLPTRDGHLEFYLAISGKRARVGNGARYTEGQQHHHA